MSTTSKLIFPILLAMLFVTLENCSNKRPYPYIISQHDRTKELERKHKFFYSSFNIILDTSGALYFHNKDSLLNCCDTGEDYNYPNYIGLQPSDLKLINDDELKHYFDSSARHPKTDKFSIQLAVYSDTINSERFYSLLDLIENEKLTNFDVRLATEEEIEVLASKKTNTAYDFYKVNWKSRFSNMIFPPPPRSEEN